MNRVDLLEQYRHVRDLSVRLCKPLEIDDWLLQSMPDCSPPKWHLAHTTWFFETFILAPHEPNYRPFHPKFNFLFNSYYEAIGERWPRPSRGLLSRPTVAQVLAYRRATDERIGALLQAVDEPTWQTLERLIEIGLNHEQQHQELLLTDLKHAFHLNPLRPAYAPPLNSTRPTTPLEWLDLPTGVHSIGHAGAGFAFDNESPRHRVFLESGRIGSRPVTVGEYLEFIEAGGYVQPEYWLADGWTARQQQGWTAPLYWTQSSTGWTTFTLHGERSLDLAEPVCHVSFYEADAYARWADARLPTEAEWEVMADPRLIAGTFLAGGRYHPARDSGAGQFFGDVWEWTASPYVAYPGYRPAAGALGEYNGKFMCNQMVLRGGSCVTPTGHVRSTYRNFFPPAARWQFSGFRLAKDHPS